MINSIKQAIANKSLEIFPTIKVYTDDIPQNFKPPLFIIHLIGQDYSKRINTKYKSVISFDVAYHSDKGVADIKSDCQDKQIELLRAFDIIDTYRVKNKKATTVDNVLHFTFDIDYSEMKVETGTLMQSQQTNTNI